MLYSTRRSQDHNSRNDVISGKRTYTWVCPELMLLSVVLSKLEYYRGIIFLTTNFLENIDNAFRSRAQIHLCYPPLSPAARTQLWRSFIHRLRTAPMWSASNDFASPSSEVTGGAIEIELLEEDFDELSEWNLNGREIKNVIKAHTWCSLKQQSLTRTRFEAFINVTTPFAEKTKTASPDSAVVQHSTGGKMPRFRI